MRCSLCDSPVLADTGGGYENPFRRKPCQACGADAGVEELRAELKRVRKQLQRAELEREILKRATAYFAKESQ